MHIKLEFGDQLDARQEKCIQLGRQHGYVVQHAVQPEAEPRGILLRFKVHVRGIHGKRASKNNLQGIGGSPIKCFFNAVLDGRKILYFFLERRDFFFGYPDCSGFVDFLLRCLLICFQPMLHAMQQSLFGLHI